jgi:hypothetical protein
MSELSDTIRIRLSNRYDDNSGDRISIEAYKDKEGKFLCKINDEYPEFDVYDLKWLKRGIDYILKTMGEEKA